MSCHIVQIFSGWADLFALPPTSFFLPCHAIVLCGQQKNVSHPVPHLAEYFIVLFCPEAEEAPLCFHNGRSEITSVQPLITGIIKIRCRMLISDQYGSSGVQWDSRTHADQTTKTDMSVSESCMCKAKRGQ